MTTIPLAEAGSPPAVKVPMRGYLGGLHDQWRDEVRGVLDPACDPAAGTWRRWRAVEYLQTGFRRRFQREQRAVASVHELLSPDQARHLWAGGEPMDEVVPRIMAATGRIDLVQVNDSKDPVDSRRDRHENLGQGQIPPDEMARMINEAGAPVAVETPGGAEEQSADIEWVRKVLGT